jgi:predicted DsbA family dithiol-disulfide isomerase
LHLEITHFTDPACPFAFSAEPARWRLRWHYGDQLQWVTRLIVLTLEEGEAEKLAAGAPNLQRMYGMPIDPAPYARPSSSEPACRAVVAARVHAPEALDLLLRRLRVRRMLGGLMDDPALIAAAAAEAGLDPAELERWCATPEVEAALQADIAAARAPTAAARALDHKLGGPRAERRYTAPSYEIVRPDTGSAASLPGFQPVETYEAAIANLAPELARRARPGSVRALLAWAGEPLATSEVVEIMGRSAATVRTMLAREAVAHAAGADCYWTLPTA